MRAITRDVYGGPEVLRWAEVERRRPGAGEVLVEVRAASLNKADLHLLRGEPFLARFAFGLRRPRAKVIGADMAGTVAAVGAGVTRLKVGDAVFGDLSGQGFGAFAEAIVAPEDALALVPAGVTFEQAAATPMAAVTALQALRNNGRLARGEHVLVTGASGGVGSFAVQIAKALGGRVTAVTRTERVDAVRALGADEVIDRNGADFREHRGRYDLIVETAGYGSVREAQKPLKPGGRYVFVGGSDATTLAALVRGKSMLARPNLDDLEAVAKMIAKGEVSPLVGAIFPLERGVEAIASFAAGQTFGKVVLTSGQRAAAPSGAPLVDGAVAVAS